MALTPVPIINPGLGDVPDPADDEAVFEADAYDFTSRMPGFGDDIKAIGDAAYANAQWAETKASEAAASAVSASDSALLAESAAGAAGAVAWVSGASYTTGNVAYSPIDFQTYRRRKNGAGTIDPSLDTTNWAILGAAYPFTNSVLMAQTHATALYF